MREPKSFLVTRRETSSLAHQLVTKHEVQITTDTCFPIAELKSQFESGTGFKGAKFLSKLPYRIRDKIVALRPYEDGDQTLHDLHKMDITRKHHRLLTVLVRPETIKISGWSQNVIFTPVSQQVYGDGETLIGFCGKSSDKPDIEFRPSVAISERGLSVPVTILLRKCVHTVQRTIDSFC